MGRSAGVDAPAGRRVRRRTGVRGPPPVPGAEPNPYAAPPVQPWQGTPPQDQPPVAPAPPAGQGVPPAPAAPTDASRSDSEDDAR